VLNEILRNPIEIANNRFRRAYPIGNALPMGCLGNLRFRPAGDATSRRPNTPGRAVVLPTRAVGRGAGRVEGPACCVVARPCC
jgi:hypothetical protein